MANAKTGVMSMLHDGRNADLERLFRLLLGVEENTSIDKGAGLDKVGGGCHGRGLPLAFNLM